MNIVDIILIIIIICIFSLALRKVIRNVKSGKMCSCCTGEDGCKECAKKNKEDVL